MHITFWGVRGSIPAPLTPKEVTEKITAALASAAYGDLTDEDYSNFAFSEYWFNVILQKIRQYKTVGYL